MYSQAHDHYSTSGSTNAVVTATLHDVDAFRPRRQKSELAPESWTGLILGGEGFKGLIPILHRSQAL